MVMQQELEKAAELGLLGNYAGARGIYESLVASGCSYAMVQLGYMEQVGKGATQNLERAEALFRDAGQNGSQLGSYYLSLLLVATKREEQGFHIMKELAEHSYLPAINRLGMMYHDGVGCNRDANAAAHYKSYAAKYGHLYAKRWVALEMLKGRRGLIQVPKGFLMLITTTLTIFWTAWRTPTDVRVQG